MGLFRWNYHYLRSVLPRSSPLEALLFSVLDNALKSNLLLKSQTYFIKSFRKCKKHLIISQGTHSEVSLLIVGWFTDNLTVTEEVLHPLSYIRVDRTHLFVESHHFICPSFLPLCFTLLESVNVRFCKIS